MNLLVSRSKGIFSCKIRTRDINAHLKFFRTKSTWNLLRRQDIYTNETPFSEYCY